MKALDNIFERICYQYPRIIYLKIGSSWHKLGPNVAKLSAHCHCLQIEEDWRGLYCIWCIFFENVVHSLSEFFIPLSLLKFSHTGCRHLPKSRLFGQSQSFLAFSWQTSRPNIWTKEYENFFKKSVLESKYFVVSKCSVTDRPKFQVTVHCHHVTFWSWGPAQ